MALEETTSIQEEDAPSSALLSERASSSHETLPLKSALRQSTTGMSSRHEDKRLSTEGTTPDPLNHTLSVRLETHPETDSDTEHRPSDLDSSWHLWSASCGLEKQENLPRMSQ